jgi:hypothetical protein
MQRNGEEIESSRVRSTLNIIWPYSKGLSKSTTTICLMLQIICIMKNRILVSKWVFTPYAAFFQTPSYYNKTQLKFSLAYVRRCHFSRSFEQRTCNLSQEWRRCWATEEAGKQIGGDRWRACGQKSGRQERILIQSSGPGVSKGKFLWEEIANFRSVWDSTKGEGQRGHSVRWQIGCNSKCNRWGLGMGSELSSRCRSEVSWIISRVS